MAPQSQVGQAAGKTARVLVKTKERIKYLTKGCATEQTNYGRLHQPGPLNIEDAGIRLGAESIKCGSQEETYAVYKKH